MTRILFICHGNICRSPTAEYIMKDLVRRAGLEDEFEIASAATSTEELGNCVYPPARRMLAAHGIDCAAHRARQMRRDDYARFDLIISMDEENRWNLDRFYAGDPRGRYTTSLTTPGGRARRSTTRGTRAIFSARGTISTPDAWDCWTR